MKNERRPPGITALSILLAFAGAVSGIMAMLILFPGAIGDPATTTASPLMITISLLLMAAACIGCVVASIGLWRLKLWGMWTALAVLCANVLSEVTDLITAQQWRNLFGIAVSGALIWYVWQKKPLFGESESAALPEGQSRSAQTSA